MYSLTFLCLVIISVASAQSGLWIKKNTETLIIPSSMSSVMGNFKEELIEGNAKSIEEKFKIISELILKSENFNVKKDGKEDTYTYVELKDSDKKSTGNIEAFVIQRTGETMVTDKYEVGENAKEENSASEKPGDVSEDVLLNMGIWDNEDTGDSTKNIHTRIVENEDEESCECTELKSCEGIFISASKCPSTQTCCIHKDHVIYPDCNKAGTIPTWNVFVKGKLNQLGFIATIIHPRVAIATTTDAMTLGSEISLVKTYGTNFERRVVGQIIHHPLKSNNNDNDIALLIWGEPLTMAPDVIPLCLPSYISVGAFSDCRVTKLLPGGQHFEEESVSINGCSNDNNTICYEDQRSYDCRKITGALVCKNLFKENKIVGLTPQTTQNRTPRRCPLGGSNLQMTKVSPISSWIVKTLQENNIIQ